MPPEVLDDELDDELDETLDDELEETLEDELLLVVVLAYEHHAEFVVVHWLAGKLVPLQATPPVKVAYTKLLFLPNATMRVPENEHWAPVFWAHFV